MNSSRFRRAHGTKAAEHPLTKKYQAGQPVSKNDSLLHHQSYPQAYRMMCSCRSPRQSIPSPPTPGGTCSTTALQRALRIRPLPSLL